MTILTSASFRWLQRTGRSRGEGEKRKKERSVIMAQYAVSIRCITTLYYSFWILSWTLEFHLIQIWRWWNTQGPTRTHTCTGARSIMRWSYLMWHVIWNTLRPNCTRRVAARHKGEGKRKRGRDGHGSCAEERTKLFCLLGKSQMRKKGVKEIKKRVKEGV